MAAPDMLAAGCLYGINMMGEDFDISLHTAPINNFHSTYS